MNQFVWTGFTSEYAFVTQCLERHIYVFKPVFQVSEVDFIVSKNLKEYFHIQVKTAGSCLGGRFRNHTYLVLDSRINFHTAKKDTRVFYSSDFIDYFAFYSRKTGKFFIIPASEFQNHTFHLSPTHRFYKQYYDNWESLI